MKNRNSPAFKHWTSIVDRFAGGNARMSDDAYRAASQKVIAAAMQLRFRGYPIQAAEIEQTQTEVFWHYMGRPYYKVWPMMTDMLRHTKLSFSGEHFQFPYRAFSVLLPTEFGKCSSLLVGSHRADQMVRPEDADPILKSETIFRREMESQLEWESTHGEIRHKLVFNWEDVDGCYLYTVLPIFADETVESALERVGGLPQGGSPIGINWSTQKDMIRVAIGVAMFGVDCHEFICPDINREEIEKRYPAGRSKASQAVSKAEVEREIANCKGWLVGSEIDLPRPHITCVGEPPVRGGELEYGHVRSGHMRMQPCGPENKDRKLIFVAPTVVRPDLPVRQSHGYRLHDRLLEGKHA